MGEYTPPNTNFERSAWAVTMDKPFDEVWTALIKHAVTRFFVINTHEKDSGLITLDFGSIDPGKFITGGKWKASDLKSSYEGDYVDFLTSYYGGRLSGKMNIVVSSLDEKTTQVQVSARYFFETTAFPHAHVQSMRWAFDTGTCGTATGYEGMKIKDNNIIRTICPTHKAEESIIKAIK
ncbi:hypothetical protein [uncultured Pseudodesulfovibrio sp.]|uniref:hypothetical protein n=1 Tax=uncultured Pseudodesulfovibrio sp. TaxID=2035858 RepID=UPI0029C60AB1|nr:hypothetical protein [uncultured Pseudodesulfovibrio sp.]